MTTTMCWQDQIVRDIDEYTVEAVVQAVVDTNHHLEERKYPAASLAMLKWHGYAYWALPMQLSSSDHALKLTNGVYFRSWFCELDDVKIDGHVYNDNAGSCIVCGY